MTFRVCVCLEQDNSFSVDRPSAVLSLSTNTLWRLSHIKPEQLKIGGGDVAMSATSHWVIHRQKSAWTTGRSHEHCRVLSGVLSYLSKVHSVKFISVLSLNITSLELGACGSYWSGGASPAFWLHPHQINCSTGCLFQHIKQLRSTFSRNMSSSSRTTRLKCSA